MKKLHKFVKRQDMFGHIIKINFDENQNTHKTLIGGIFTIIICASLLDMISTKLLAMF